MIDSLPSPEGENTASIDPFRAEGKTLVVMLGPTAIGKTSLAIALAKELGTEIISADSRQFFREMNIGTAKPDEYQLKSVKHHFINSLSVKDEYNVGMFERDALNVLEKIFEKQGTAVMAGGSGLYINAVCNGFDEMPPADKAIRIHLEKHYKENGIEALQTLLKKHDEDYYRKVDIKNPHRLLRAIEVCMITGKKYSELRKRDEGRRTKDEGKRQFNTIKIGLHLERKELYKKINARVDEMMGNGLLEEVKSLFSAYGGQGSKLNSMQTLGYKELFEHLEGKYDLQKAIALIKQNTRNFAKRQMTWFRKDKDIKWFGPDEKEKILQHIKKTVSHSYRISTLADKLKS